MSIDYKAVFEGGLLYLRELLRIENKNLQLRYPFDNNKEFRQGRADGISNAIKVLEAIRVGSYRRESDKEGI